MSEAETRFRVAMKNESASRVLADFLRERRQKVLEELAGCNEKTFPSHQGRIRELDTLINLATNK